MNQLQSLQTLTKIRKFAQLLDAAFTIPGTKFKVGLDPIIGLIPGAGDLVATGFSVYLLFLAVRFNLPSDVFRKMVFNIALEFGVGLIPLVGDLFDAYYKSNLRNLALLEQHLQEENSPATQSSGIATPNPN